MEKNDQIYIAFDLKSFYASVECMERGLNPLTTNLVVADDRKTEKTICLAVSPSLKKYGIPGRPRLFEVIQKVELANALENKKIEYIVAPPRMALYLEYSTKIYTVYLKYFSPNDMHVYSIDEVFVDVTSYLLTYKVTAYELAEKVIQDILDTTGITATAGIGTNLYLCKIAMDIMAKKSKPNQFGVRIAELNEITYRKELWNHRPLTDFWRVGKGYAKKLASVGIYTMKDIAKCSIGEENEYYNESLLYKLFGINAELLIDHAWGIEPCQMKDIKSYKPTTNSVTSGQVLQSPYSFASAKNVVCEMVDLLVLDLVDKGLVTNQIVMTIGYDIENLSNPEIAKKYKGEIVKDSYGRRIPKHAQGTTNFKNYTSSTNKIMRQVTELYDAIVDEMLSVRRINISANHVIKESDVVIQMEMEQLSLFTDYIALEENRVREERELEKEREIQKALLTIKKKYGKNAILKGMNFVEGATAKERNEQIGGHKA
ncbi:MAG: DNA methylase [Lachnospiraceae bacterium]